MMRAHCVLPALSTTATGSSEISGTKYMNSATGFFGDSPWPKFKWSVGPVVLVPIIPADGDHGFSMFAPRLAKVERFNSQSASIRSEIKWNRAVIWPVKLKRAAGG